MAKVSAVVFTAVGCVNIQEVDIPAPGPGQVQIRTHYSTISTGTETWLLRNLFFWSPTQYPCVPGYQRAGIVEALGEGVTTFQVGQRVAATRSEWNGAVHPQSGAHIALANTAIEEVYALPSSVDAVEASALVVAQVGYNAANRLSLQTGNWVLVYGDGLIGQFAAQAARARGAHVILVGHRPERLAIGLAYSADKTINRLEQNVADFICREIGISKVAAVLDSVQTEESQQEYVPLLERSRGQIVYCGFTPADTWADMGLLQRTELTTHFISGWTRPRMEATLNLMAVGKIRVRPLITHLEDYVKAPDLYHVMQQKTGGTLGTSLRWGGL
ncbi:MAG: zinc-binding dehydrogenase [Aggregatilineales bacterium]